MKLALLTVNFGIVVLTDVMVTAITEVDTPIVNDVALTTVTLFNSLLQRNFSLELLAKIIPVPLIVKMPLPPQMKSSSIMVVLWIIVLMLIVWNYLFLFDRLRHLIVLPAQTPMKKLPIALNVKLPVAKHLKSCAELLLHIKIPPPTALLQV